MAKTKYTLLLISSLLSSFALFAQGFSEPGSTGQGFSGPRGGTQGFNGPSQGINTVASALRAPDDSFVVLTGNIVSSLGGEMYQFRDNTGSIVIEIDDDEWYGISATPKTRLVISGEIDKDWGETATVDVKSVRLPR